MEFAVSLGILPTPVDEDVGDNVLFTTLMCILTH